MSKPDNRTFLEIARQASATINNELSSASSEATITLPTYKWLALIQQFNRLDAKERKQTSTNKQNASKPRGQRVPDSEASARTLARRKAKAA